MQLDRLLKNMQRKHFPISRLLRTERCAEGLFFA